MGYRFAGRNTSEQHQWVRRPCRNACAAVQGLAVGQVGGALGWCALAGALVVATARDVEDAIAAARNTLSSASDSFVDQRECHCAPQTTPIPNPSAVATAAVRNAVVVSPDIADRCETKGLRRTEVLLVLRHKSAARPATQTKFTQYRFPLPAGRLCPKCVPVIDTVSPPGSTLTFS